MPDKVPDKVRDTVSSTARAWVRPRPFTNVITVYFAALQRFARPDLLRCRPT